MKNIIIVAALSAGLVANAHAAGRNTISVVGSSTVYPFATVVAEKFGKKTSFATPKIESTGSGGGMKLFCNGVGPSTPDITNASRRIKKSEFDKCHKNGVTGIVEVHIGFDGIAVANSKKSGQLKLSRKDLFLALAGEVPNPDGSETLVKNPYKTWNASATRRKNSAKCSWNSRISASAPPPMPGSSTSANWSARYCTGRSTRLRA